MNKLDIFIKNVDLDRHAALIKIGLKKTLDIVKRQQIEVQTMKQFKKLFMGIDKYDHNKEMHRIVYLSALLIRPEILLYEKKIEPWLYKLRNEWFEYLFNRIFPFLDSFSNQILEELHYDYPFGDIEVYSTLAERIVFNIERCKYSEEVYQKYLFNEKISPWARILEFENHYRFEYALFLIRSAYFGKEMSKFEEKEYQLKSSSIFQLFKNNEITPKSKVLVQHLKRLQFIRNAIAHPERAGIRYLKKKHRIKIMNYNPQEKKYTYEEEITLNELWNIGFILTMLDRTFIDVTLALSLIKTLNPKSKSI